MIWDRYQVFIPMSEIIIKCCLTGKGHFPQTPTASLVLNSCKIWKYTLNSEMDCLVGFKLILQRARQAPTFLALAFPILQVVHQRFCDNKIKSLPLLILGLIVPILALTEQCHPSCISCRRLFARMDTRSPIRGKMLPTKVNLLPFGQFWPAFSSHSQAINNKTLSSAKFFVMLTILLTYMQTPGALRAGWVPWLLVELPVRDSVLIGLICVQMLLTCWKRNDVI